MHSFIECALGFDLHWTLYIILISDTNEIGESGVRQLSKCRWQNLNKIDLSNMWIIRLQSYWKRWLQVVEPVSVAKAQIIIDRHFFANLEMNSISKTGCRWLSKSNWKSLDTLNLRSIEII